MPVECLHTVLLGACKYMLRSFMNQASNSTKKEILAIISSFPQCGFSTRLTGNICYYYKSFVGHDFKTWLQMCVFVLQKYLSPDETKCWFLLAKVKFYFSLLVYIHMYIADINDFFRFSK